MGQQRPVEAGAETQGIARLHLDLVRLQYPHQPLIADRDGLQSDMGEQVDHHPTGLHPGFGDPLDPQRHRAIGAGFASRPCR